MQKLSYSVPIAFIIMEIHLHKNTKSKKYSGKALQCNKNFYLAVKLYRLLLALGTKQVTTQVESIFNSLGATSSNSIDLNADQIGYTI